MIQLGERLACMSLCWMQGYCRRYVDTSVGRIHVLERAGSGRSPPLVLLHGLSSAGVHYLRMLRHLEGFSRIVVIDLPGHGFSDAPATIGEASLLAGAFEAFDQLLDRPALLCGNSLGGYVAIRYALARPERVAGLMLVSPAGAAMEADELHALRARFKLTSHREALRFADDLLARRSRIRHLYAIGLRRIFALPKSIAVLESMELSHLFGPGQLGSLAMPVLLIWGAEERILPASHLQFFRDQLPAQARIERPAGWGHSAFLDSPRGFAHRLMRFADELQRPPAPPR